MKLLIILSALAWQDAAPATQATGAALAWRDRQVEIEEFLKTGPIERVFDALIANTDRNAGNIVVDPNWNMVFVDHSRSFSDTLKIPHLDRLERIDRPFFGRLKALEYHTIQAALGQWLRNPRCASALMARRNRIVKHFETLAAKKRELAVFSQ